MKESQLTFSDISSSGTDEIYDSIVELAFSITGDERSRSGDNCPTISETTPENSSTREFSVKLPPKTRSVTLEDIPTSYTVEFINFTREQLDELFIFVVTADVDGSTMAESVAVQFIFPAEDPEIDEEQEETDENRRIYEQFDFKKFISESSVVNTDT